MTFPSDDPHQTKAARKSKLVRWIFVAVGLIFTSVGASFLYSTYAFQQTAIATTAEVLSVETFRKRKRDNDGHMKTSITYEPTLRYRDHFGAEHVATPNIRSSSYNFPVGSEVEVAFSPDDPGEVRVNDFLSTWGFGGLFALFGLVFAGIGWFATRTHERKLAARTQAVTRQR